MKEEPDDNKVSGERRAFFRPLKHTMRSKGLSFSKRREEGRFELEVWGRRWCQEESRGSGSGQEEIKMEQAYLQTPIRPRPLCLAKAQRSYRYGSLAGSPLTH